METVDCVVEFEPSAIARNYTAIREKVGPKVEISAVIKANAYGLGIERLTPLLREAGVEVFFVATTEEGIRTRKALGEASGQVYVLDPFVESEIVLFNTYDLSPILNDIADVESFIQGGKGTCGIHLDLGMHRIGLMNEEITKVLKDREMIKKARVDLLMTHFPSLDPIPEKNYSPYRQLEVFLALTKPYPNIRKSVAASEAIWKDSKFHLDLVRPGMLIDGLVHIEGTDTAVALTYRAPVAKIYSLDPPANVGYGCHYTVSKPGKYAAIRVGYADGVPLDAGFKGCHFSYDGQRLPIVGEVSMDITTVSLEYCKNLPAVGDLVQVLGPTDPTPETWQILTGQERCNHVSNLLRGQRYRWKTL